MNASEHMTDLAESLVEDMRDNNNYGWKTHDGIVFSILERMNDERNALDIAISRSEMQRIASAAAQKLIPKIEN